jgi:hypothetical protein
MKELSGRCKKSRMKLDVYISRKLLDLEMSAKSSMHGAHSTINSKNLKFTGVFYSTRWTTG